MNRAQRRAAGIPSRPNMIPETLRKEYAGAKKTYDRDQSIQFVAMLAANLNNLLGAKEQLPWVQSTIERRSDGFSLHVQVVAPSVGEDAEVLNGQQH